MIFAWVVNLRKTIQPGLNFDDGKDYPVDLIKLPSGPYGGQYIVFHKAEYGDWAETTNLVKANDLPIATDSELGCVKVGDNLVSDSTTGTLSLDQNPTVNTIALPSLSHVIKIPEVNDIEPQPLVVYLDHEPEEGYVYKTGVLYLIKE